MDIEHDGQAVAERRMHIAVERRRTMRIDPARRIEMRKCMQIDPHRVEASIAQKIELLRPEPRGRRPVPHRIAVHDVHAAMHGGVLIGG